MKTHTQLRQKLKNIDMFGYHAQYVYVVGKDGNKFLIFFGDQRVFPKKKKDRAVFERTIDSFWDKVELYGRATGCIIIRETLQ